MVLYLPRCLNLPKATEETCDLSAELYLHCTPQLENLSERVHYILPSEKNSAFLIKTLLLVTLLY